MPPAIPTESDAESVAEGQITPKAEPSAKQAKTELKDTVMKEAEAQKAEPEGEEEEESGDDEGYEPEAILGHRADFDQEPGISSTVRYLTKWVGYENVRDQTWEPEENYTNSRDLLEAYWETIGGRPEGAEAKGKKGGKGRASLSKKRSKADLQESESPAPKKQKRGRKSIAQEEDENPDTPEFRGYVDSGHDDWKPPKPKAGEWDKVLQKVDTIEQDDANERWAYLCWNDKNSDGRFYRSKAKLPTVYTAAPQAMLRFYEQHLVFTDKKADYLDHNPEHVQNGEGIENVENVESVNKEEEA
ncbi:hypothetical protein G7Y79_00015g038340 [Physcia stellaris]|nr:hypothetical protein G7Y79_00015g038340 [Physcia stellaris]